MNSQPVRADATAPLVNRDEEHLRLLGIYHITIAIISAIGIVVLLLPPLVAGPATLQSMAAQAAVTPEVMRQRLLAGLVLGVLMTLLYVFNGLSLKNKRNRISCFVMSIAECLNFPLGMILGVSAIMVLRRETVKTLFDANASGHSRMNAAP